jgi:hypothetical protein
MFAKHFFVIEVPLCQAAVIAVRQAISRSVQDIKYCRRRMYELLMKFVKDYWRNKREREQNRLKEKL